MQLTPVITDYSLMRFNERARVLGLTEGAEELKQLLAQATEETPSGKKQWHLFARCVVHGDSKYLTFGGWRFVVSNERVVTVEREKPHENYGFPIRTERKRTLCKTT